MTDRRPMNLPQLFMQSKGIGARHEVKSTEAVNFAVLHETLTRSLDEFCAKVLDLRNGTEKYLYQQIVFNFE